MNRNTHGEERRQVEKATRSERIAWIESLVGQLRSLVSCVCWSNCGKYRHVGEDTIYRSRVRNKRPILRYFLAMMIM
ncbi:hypothetical protein T4B_14266 [Trichinella pseudospiralis]|uniref:Uncharacterized protein n=1 Tax=Trichinella pseudospiralis TaxID=6337 RepID=A0A0V1GIK5_TRIPS|nr:hypothetical protein T4B_14266 [Trichinella pseudospiralis]